MACFRNDARGARTIRKTDGTYLLVEAGATASVERRLIKSIAPGLVNIEDPDELPEVPSDLAAKVSESGDDLKALRAEYHAKIGKRPGPSWDAAEIKRRMAEA